MENGDRTKMVGGTYLGTGVDDRGRRYAFTQYDDNNNAFQSPPAAT